MAHRLNGICDIQDLLRSLLGYADGEAFPF